MAANRAGMNDENAAYVAEHRDEIRDALGRLSSTWAWFLANRDALGAQYAGKWVALEAESVVAACGDRTGLRAELAAQGRTPAEVVIVPL